ncbi:MAG: response regulator [Candidatus Faecousia sp.]|nr:response regulator [Candidatus Faecousia sp.]
MLRVFLVEDETIIRETLRDTVPWAQCGFTFAGEAADGEMALPLIQQTRPDVLITDIRMPFMDGLALSKLVLQEFPHMKVIILSGYDDFEYAQKAIGLGVERYLLKPITKSTLMTVLEEVREKIRGERAQQNYLTQFHQEAQDYEQYARRRFFEKIVAGQLSVQEIYEQAEKLDLDLRAQAYDIALVSAMPERSSEAYSEPGARIRDGLVGHFLKHPEYILFRWNLTGYAVLLLGNQADMERIIRRCVDKVRQLYETYGPELNWYVAVGTPTQRLSALPGCFEEVSRLWAYRHILPEQHILSADTVKMLTETGADHDLSGLDMAKVNPAMLTGVLQSASAQEISSFVDEYVHSLEDALESKPFCQYLMLSARFTATQFVETLGIGQAEFLPTLNCLNMVGQQVSIDDLKRYLSDVLLRAIELRDKVAGSQYKGQLKQAVSYIDANFQSEDISLNRVAKEVNISPNYLSAVFSQEMGTTFVEYLTAKRMEKARELLRSSDLRSGEIATAVGYKDSHYFSFLFKKTQGCTPRDYRGGKGKK